MQVNFSSTPAVVNQSAERAASKSNSNKASQSGSRGFTFGQGLTVAVGALAALQGLKPANARVLTQTSDPHNATLIGELLNHIGDTASPASMLASPNISAKPAPVLATPPPTTVGRTPTASPTFVGRTPTATPPPLPHTFVPTAAPTTNPGTALTLNPNLGFTRSVVSSSLLSAVPLSSTIQTVDTSLPYHAPNGYETCHALTSGGNVMCVQGIALNKMSLLATAGSRPLTCGDTAHAFWTAENAAWGKHISEPLLFSKVVQFASLDNCCLVYESNLRICDDMFPAQNECKDDIATSCAAATAEAQQAILREGTPNAYINGNYDTPGLPGSCGINANNQFSCLEQVNKPAVGGPAAGTGSGLVDVYPNTNAGGCTVDASTGRLSPGC